MTRRKRKSKKPTKASAGRPERGGSTLSEGGGPISRLRPLRSRPGRVQPLEGAGRRRVRVGVNALLGLIIVAGLLHLALSPGGGPRSKVEDPGSKDLRLSTLDLRPLPPLTFETTPEGARAASMDSQLLAEWCRSAGLPNPPPIDHCEPAVAEAVVAALREAATTPTAQSFARLGRICYALEGYQSAKRYFMLAAQRDPRDFRWPYCFGCMCQAMGQTDEAIEAFAKVLRLNERYAMTHARLGQLYLDADRLDEAEAHLRRYVELRPKDWLGNVGLGRVALRHGDYETALRFLRTAAEQAPGDFQVHYYLGRTYAALNRADLAKEEFDIVKTLPKGNWFGGRDPLLQEAKSRRGGIDSAAALVDELEKLQNSGDWVRMAQLTEKIVARRPGDAVMSANLASLYRAQKRFADAHAVLDRALKLKPDSARLHVTRAEVYLTESRYEQACSAAKAALKIDADSPGAYNVLGRALFSLNRPGEAEVAMRRAVELDPLNPDKIFILGEFLRRSGKTAEAVEAFEKTLELAPGHARARGRIDQIEQGN